MSVSFGIVVGFIAWFVVRYLLAGLYTVDQNERAVKTVLGRAQRLGDETTLDDRLRRACGLTSAIAIAIRNCASFLRAARISSGRGSVCTRCRSRRGH